MAQPIPKFICFDNIKWENICNWSTHLQQDMMLRRGRSTGKTPTTIGGRQRVVMARQQPHNTNTMRMTPPASVSSRKMPVSNRQQCHSTAKNNTNASTTAASTSSRNAQQLLPHTPSYSNNNRSNANPSSKSTSSQQQQKQVGVAQGFHYNINSNNHHSNANIHEEQDIMDAQAIEDGLQGGYGKRDDNGQQDDDHYHGNEVLPGERPTEENISLHSTRTGKSTAVMASSLSVSEEDNVEEELQTSMKNYQCELHATTTDNLLEACKAMATTKGLGGRVIEKNRERSVKSKVEKYTKNIVFKKIKFIADQEELGSLREKGAIGNIIMDYMNIQDQSKRYSWWMLYQDVVKCALDQQRSNCNIAIKEVVVGKCWCARAC